MSIAQEFKRRADLLHKITPDNRQALFVYYKNNIIGFINDWGITVNPKTIPNPTYLPFVLFEKQVEYIKWLEHCLDNKLDGVCEKCRGVGVTWLNCIFSVHKLIFLKGFSAGFGSRVEKDVDSSGDLDSMFEKIRFIIANLPPFLRPNIQSANMRILNIDNGSSIVGGSGDNIGRGGRKTIFFLDEAAAVAHPKAVDAALSQNTNVKIHVSTHKGTNTEFYKKVMSPSFEHFKFLWTDDPRNTQEWYDREKLKLDPVTFAQEIDCDPHASAGNVVIKSEWIKAAINFDAPKGYKRAGLDVADTGGDYNSLALVDGCCVVKVDTWKSDTTTTSRNAHAKVIDFGAKELIYDAMGVGAGVRGELNSLKTAGLVDYNILPFVAGSTDLKGKYSDDRANKDMFSNIKAFGWWELRRRFENTYNYVNGDTGINLDETISIPDDSVLFNELAQATYGHNQVGKIMIDKKGNNTKSPDRADSVMMCFANLKPVEIIFAFA